MKPLLILDSELRNIVDFANCHRMMACAATFAATATAGAVFFMVDQKCWEANHVLSLCVLLGTTGALAWSCRDLGRKQREIIDRIRSECEDANGHR